MDGFSMEVRLMFEKLFGKVSDVLYHTIAPCAVERQRFLEHVPRTGLCEETAIPCAG